MLLAPYDKKQEEGEKEGTAVKAGGKKQKKSLKGGGSVAAAAAAEAGTAAAAAAAPSSAAAGGVGSVGRPQVLLFSATMPAEVSAAAGVWLRGAREVRVSAGADNAISRTVTQVVHVCAEHKKPDKLLKHLARIRASTPAGSRTPPRVLVFANRVKTVRFLTATLTKEGYKVAQLHGQRSQAERNAAVSDFRCGKAQVLVATDVAARGLDIRSLPYVVNYDFPCRLETYVHRVGRTGRLAAYGHAYSFFTRNMAPLAPPLLSLLQSHEQAVDPNLAALAAAWKMAEEKLGAAGAAAAAARIREEAAAGSGNGEERDDEEEGDDDDEGDASAAAEAAGRDGKLSFAEEVLGAAEDLAEGLGPRDARAIAELVRKKLMGGSSAGEKKKQKQLQQQQRQREEEEQEEEEGDGGADDEGAARPGKKARKEAAGSVAAAAASQGETTATGRSRRPGDELLVPTTREQKRVQQQQQEGGAAGRLAAYLPAKSFTGARAGYVFKKGPMGLGYYPDQPLLATAGGKAKQAAAAAAAKGGAAEGAAVATQKKAAGKAAAAGAAKPAAAASGKTAAAAAWGLPTRNKPIIPVRHSDFLSDSDEENGNVGGYSSGDSDLESDSDKQPAPSKSAVPKSAAAAVAARKRVGKAGAGVGGSDEEEQGGGSDGSGDDGDDDDEFPEGGQRAVAKQKHKSLPGRLRKKLAKMKAQQGQAQAQGQQQQGQQQQGGGRGGGAGRPAGKKKGAAGAGRKGN
ncbi:hypothetical protein Agub_g11610 [Astrephomene gubernaculifera]|uniref:Helicase C-terminal domain-containing protein n=1 Tax=Astrephomene gubernaculifera TaxID=47775 RepID=A0AAD3HQM8_9CHLO|nr:hypothetical protein Agub_g11610 [Astrephomene gubernaculifera]